MGFLNALPVFIASDPTWAPKFGAAGVPIVGDDIKSQVGATVTHYVLAKLLEDRGVRLERTYQLNFGGNMDGVSESEGRAEVQSVLDSRRSIHGRRRGDHPMSASRPSRRMCISQKFIHP